MINPIRLNRSIAMQLLVVMFCCVMAGANAAQDPVGDPDPSQPGTGYVAKNEGIQMLFNAVSARAKKPFILSKLAQKKNVTGDFDITEPMRFLDKISVVLNLIWYDDGQSVFIYDNSELKSSVVILRNATIKSLNDFLQQTGLASKRYPIRGESKNNAFYISGPPAYVEIVTNAAAYLDDLYKNVDLNKQRISIVKLHNSFVNDRSLSVRGQQLVVPGMAKVIESILQTSMPEDITLANAPPAQPKEASIEPQKARSRGFTGQIRVIPYPDTNSLLIKGTQEQIDLIEMLIEQLDVPKRHIELSLWIIDINKSDLDQLGVNWTGGVSVGNKVQVNFNSTLNGTQFLAEISALSSKGLAEIVSRPIILTQDNVPASFDHNNTFYAKLQAERVASLESVTYGTLINVLPRYSQAGDEVEMILDIEDGQNDGTLVDGLPVVGRTKLSTVARVPKDKSLLIGGYTLDNRTKSHDKIPGLGDLPFIGGAFRSDSETVTKSVRIFLIQPRLLDLGEVWTTDEFKKPPQLAPDMPLKDTVDLLRNYSGARGE